MTKIHGQSRAAQDARLDRGCCPIHGIATYQIGGWFEMQGSEAFTIVECPRKDCDFLGLAHTPDGPIVPVSREQVLFMTASSSRKAWSAFRVAHETREDDPQ